MTGTDHWSSSLVHRYSCPISFHMNKVVGNLHIDFEDLHPALPQNKGKVARADSAFLRRLQGTGDFCTRIQSHFPSLFLEKEELEEYLETLRGCRIRG